MDLKQILKLCIKVDYASRKDKYQKVRQINADDLNTKNMDWNSRLPASMGWKLQGVQRGIIMRSIQRIVQLTIQIGRSYIAMCSTSSCTDVISGKDDPIYKLLPTSVIWSPWSTAQAKQQTKFWKPITIISDLNSNCQLPKPGGRRNFYTHKTHWKCCINNERPTGKKHTSVGWDDGWKICKIIN